MKLTEYNRVNVEHEMDRLRKIKRLSRMIIRHNFSVKGGFDAEPHRVDFFPEDKEQSRQLAFEVGELFEVEKWKREFADWNGQFSYISSFQLDNCTLVLIVWDAPVPSNCKIIPYTETVTKYKKECEGE